MDREPAGGNRFACAICSAPICALDRASGRPFRCRSGHSLAVDELIFHDRANGLEDALYGVAHCLQESTRVVENLAYVYRRRRMEQLGG